MNCKKAEQLIPLFIEADLDAAEMQKVRHHLETCAACQTTVAEFEASQSLLRSVAMPAFDEAMLVEMRSAVMQRVAQPATRSASFDWLQPIWNWKFAFAAAAVILVVFGVAIRQRGGKPIDNPVASEANAARSDLAVVRKSPDITTPPAAQPFQPRMGRKHKAQGGVRVSERHPENSAIKQLSPERATIVDNQIAIAIAPSGAGKNAAILPGIGTPGFMLPPARQAENAILPPDKNTNEPEMLKMEFQTADPNIRIIWLTPKEPARTTPAEDSK